jgi:translation initiation factor 2-alpha kinase 1
MYEQNPSRKERLFKALCDLLIKARIISPAWTVTEFSTLRRQINTGFVSLLQGVRDSVSQDAHGVVTDNGVRPHPMQLLLSSTAVPTGVGDCTDWLDYLPSKFVEEFTDIKHISKGAYGKVYMAKKKSDGITYAVKKIILDDREPIHSTFNEVKVMAALSHPNIVRYYDNWIEHQKVLSRDNVSVPSRTSVQPQNPSLSSSSTGRSPAASHTGTSTHNAAAAAAAAASDDDDSDGSIVFQGPSVEPHPANNDLAIAVPIAKHNRAIVGKTQPANGAYFRTVHHVGTNASVPVLLQRVHQYILYIQMELCHMTLRDWLDDRNHSHTENVSDLVKDDENKHLLKQMLKGLKYIHSQDLLHRDLKPQNIFLSRDVKGFYRVKIGDFGLSRLLTVNTSTNTSSSQSSCTDGHVVSTDGLSCGVGNDLYSAPEQLTSMCYSSRADMYSIGLILFELYRPFTTAMERLECLKQLRVKHDVGTLNQLWPVQANCVLDLTQHDPDRRPSASSLLSGECGLFLTKDQMIKELRTQVSELHQQVYQKNRRIAELEQQLELRNLCAT